MLAVILSRGRRKRERGPFIDDSSDLRGSGKCGECDKQLTGAANRFSFSVGAGGV